MFKGLGKFSLLLAGAALLVVSCGQNQGASPESSGDSASQNWPKAVSNPVSATPEEIGILPYDETQKIVSQVRLDPDVIAAVRDVGGVDWKNRAFAIQKEEGTAVMVWPADTDERMVLVFLDPSAGLLDPLRISATSVRISYDGQKTSAVTIWRAGDYSEESNFEGTSQSDWTVDWTPLGIAHHPEIPTDPPVCTLDVNCQALRKKFDDAVWDQSDHRLTKDVDTWNLVLQVGIGAVVNDPLCAWVESHTGPQGTTSDVVCNGVMLVAWTAAPAIKLGITVSKLARAADKVHDAKKDWLDNCLPAGIPPILPPGSDPGDVCTASIATFNNLAELTPLPRALDIASSNP